MADDVNEQVFNEKQLYTGDVVGEDEEDGRATIPYTFPGAAKTASTAEVATSAITGRDRRKKKASERATKIVYWLESKYDILFEMCAAMPNWKESPSAAYDYDFLWSDTSCTADRFMKLKLYQKMNHFVGMSSITRKNNLGRNLLRMRKQFPTEYKFFPDTWILPTDLSDFKMQFTSAKNRTFIIKPDNGCQGKGIFLVRDGDKVPVDFSTTYVAQRYIHKPFLLSGCKFDLRLYVLVTGCDPLRIFIHKRGLVRLASEQYVEPTKQNLVLETVHLTNYAINKENPNFKENTNPEDAHDGHKRSWEAVWNFLKDAGHDVSTMMAGIEDLIVKTLIAVQPSLSHFYHSCQPDDVENCMSYEILGFDVMLDHKLQPWLIEVNHAPSFATESELDRVVKEEVLRDTFQLLNLSPETRRRHKREAREKMEQRAMGVLKKQSMDDISKEAQKIAIERTTWEDAHLNGYKRLYPSEAKEREYEAIHDAAINIWEMLMGGNSRRSVRLTSDIETEEKGNDKRKGESDSSRGGDQAPASVKEKRSADEMREVVERLSAGCSARPREKIWPRKRATSTALPSASTASTVASGSVGGDGDAPAGDADPNEAESTLPEPDVEVKPQPRPEVQVGDVIKVQTNLGWENVTVKAKRTNGKIDIQFKDGEYMRSVLPRILRESVPVRVGDSLQEEATGTNGAEQASSSSSVAVPKTARSGLGSTASKVQSLPPPYPSLENARGVLAAGAAAHAAGQSMPLGMGSFGGAVASSSKEASYSAAATVPGVSGAIAAAAANVFADRFADPDRPSHVGHRSSATPVDRQGSKGKAGLADDAEEVINSLPGGFTALSSLTSNDRSILSQLQKQRPRLPSGDANMRGPLADPSPLAVPTPQQGMPMDRRGTGLRPVAANAGVLPPPCQEKVHEVRLRNHLQQLICVRPIVTRRKAGGVDEAPKSPRSSVRRQSTNSFAHR